ncbi:MerR family transcriptional regulator [Clostridium sp. 'deep sea']|uniref:helix-turn-helix domain-containing protein n=1 Tax=Clostridium sp. 'deep sea' TaxID=2779445 RepID=UPI0018965C77|nr:MerR family transcriptional regulator [Clostridium sp. 'deep sea']QOR35509.1 MerR family transcriptional regulator [Clostridium sp. 'deep sea']
MLINEAVKATHLTKKAIRYYEEKGLIFPVVNEENGYKIFSINDIEKLKQISFLRNIGMPVSVIKDYLNNPNNRELILKQFSKNISEQIEDLKFAKQIIIDMLNNKITDYEKLNDILLISQQSNKNYVIKQLLRLFPNPFGKQLVAHFSPFLNEPLNSPEKKQAFNEIIEFFDNLDEIPLPKELAQEYESMDDKKLFNFYENVQNKIKDMLKIDLNDKTAMLKLKEDMKKYADIRNDMNDASNKMFVKVQKQLGDTLKASGYYDKFVVNMKIISSDYKQYTENIIKLGEVLLLSYDEEGNAVVGN